MAVGNENIKFSDLYSIITGTTHSNESISLSDFRGGKAGVPMAGAISINSHFKGQSFDIGNLTIETLKELFTDAALEKMYTALTGAGGTMYNINNDMRYGPNNISDGGNDMYDDGNKISFNNSSNGYLTYTNTITSNGIGNGKYFIKIGPSATNRFFIFVADVDSSIANVQINGDNGADNMGTAIVGDLTITKSGTEYKIFWKSVSDNATNDPTINHIWIVKNAGVLSREYAGNTNNDYHKLNINSSIDRVYYIMWGGTVADGHTNSTEVTAVVNYFLGI